jgi:hypothetical protein
MSGEMYQYDRSGKVVAPGNLEGGQTIKPAYRAGLLRISVFFIGLAALVGFLGLANLPLSIGEHALGLAFDIATVALGFWLLVLVYGWVRHRGRFDVFEFPIWLSLNAFGQAILSWWLFQRNQLPSIPWLRGNYGPMTTAVWLICLCLTALWVGYVWAYRHLDRRPGLIRPRAGQMRTSVVLALWFV